MTENKDMNSKEHSRVQNSVRQYQKIMRLYSHLLKQLTLIVLCFVMLFLVSGCNLVGEDTFASEKGNLTMTVVNDQNQWFPALWVKGTKRNFNPMYATKTQMDTTSQKVTNLLLTDMGLSFTIEDDSNLTFSYVLKDKQGNPVDTGMFDITINQADQSYQFSFFPKKELNMSLDETYLLEVTAQADNMKAYYYTNLTYSQINGNDAATESIQNNLVTMNKNDAISFLNEPRYFLNADNSNQFTIRAEYTGAKRLENGFEYKDYIKLFNIDLITMIPTLISEYSIDKQRYYYDNNSGGWNLGTQELEGKEYLGFNPYIRKVISSQNQRYQLIANDYELYLYDVTSEKLSEIYRLDSFDSDYVYDEYMNHKIHVFDVTDEGDVIFALLGYIHDESEMSQRNGIVFYEYHNNNLKQIGFMENPNDGITIDNYLTNHSYYNQKTKNIYFFDEQILYQFDMETEKFSYVEAFIDGVFYPEEGILVWQGNDTKYNGAIFCINLADEQLTINNLFKTGVYKRLLGVSKSSLIVGIYDIEDTYEQLNGDIIYPFKKIEIYDFNKNLIGSFSHLDYGEEKFFSKAYFDDVTNEWMTDLVERRIEVKEDYKNSRIQFVSLDQRISLETSELKPESQSSFAFPIKEVYSNYLISTKKKDSSIIFLKEPGFDKTMKLNIQFAAEPERDVYKIIDKTGAIKYANTLIDALKLSKQKGDYKIYYSSNSLNQKKEDLMFDSSNLMTSQYLELVKILAQRPELPRGCEVTSLAVLLDYYMDQGPSKMELADGIKSSTMESRIIDGFMNFADMHVEFSGSMTDTSLPGLGVYIDPILNLASKYIQNKAANITGLSFEQLLTFVSNKQPVLVIIPNRYQAVASYGIEVWKTAGGYMEVTYQEHSVVVMGFDENYIYYSDPSKGIVDKKPINSFKEAWESIGKQALVIIE